MSQEVMENIATAVSETTTAQTQSKPAVPTAGSAEAFWWGTGRRKTSVARVRIRNGTGKFLIKGREVDQYFSEARDRNAVRAPLTATQYEGKIDIFVNVRGGGYAGQAGAVMLGIARALKLMDAGLEGALRDGGYLTRDARMVERKKYGRSGARKSFQFSKR
jgi:small subunit ribosomal protein S9